MCRDPWRSLSYGELADATRRFAGALRAAGIAREQRVVLLMLDTIDFPIAFWGAIRAGVVPVPINTLLTHEMVGYILADSRAAALVISAPLVEPLLPVLHSVPELRRIIVTQPDGSVRRRGWTMSALSGSTGSSLAVIRRLRRLARQRMRSRFGYTHPAPRARQRACATCTVVCVRPPTLTARRYFRCGQTM